MYSVEFSKLAERQFFRLEKEIQRRIVAVLERISIRPFHFVKKIVGSPYYRLRVGNYRIILDIKQDKLIIFVIGVGHRRRIYKHYFAR